MPKQQQFLVGGKNHLNNASMKELLVEGKMTTCQNGESIMPTLSQCQCND